MMEKKQKDWKGNNIALFSCNTCNSHSKETRQIFDFYATDPLAIEWLMKLEPQISNVWECFVGTGNLAEPLRREGKLRAISDIVDRGYYPENIMTSYGKDFFQMTKIWKGDIVSNPPYAQNLESVKHCLELLIEGHYLAMFMKLTFLEGKERKKFFKDNPPLRVWVSSSRIYCAKNNQFLVPKKDKDGNVKLDKDGNPIMERQSSAACYAWFIWQKGYKGDTIIKWFN